MKIVNVRYEIDELTQVGGKAIVSKNSPLLSVLEVLTTKEKMDLNSFFIMQNMIQEIKLEASEAIKDLSKQILKEILQPEQIVKKPTKKEQFELDIKRKSEERMLSLIKKHSKRNN